MIFSQEYSQIALAVALSLISGIGVYLLGRREGRLRGGFWDLLTEIFLALTAGLMAFYIGKYQQWSDSVTSLSILLASNNSTEVLNMAKRINMEALGNGLTKFFSKGGK